MKEELKLILFHKHLTGELSSEEEIHLKTLLNQSQSDKDLFKETEFLWMNTATISKPVPNIDKNELKSKIFYNFSSNENKVKIIDINRRKNKFFSYIGIAASIVIICAVSIGLIIRSQNSLVFTGNESFAINLLPDESKVWLSNGSSLEYNKGIFSDQRNVVLEGTAFFDVKHDMNKPFIISVGKNKITVLGTSFEVQQYKDSSVEVTVHRGKVRLSDDKNNSLVLSKNESGFFDSGTGKFEIRTKNRLSRVGRNEFLTFNNANLDDVFAKLEVYFDCKINIKCSKITNFAGFTSPSFGGDKIEDYFTTITKLYDIEIKYSDTGVYDVLCR
jgi:transmembrane sensor